MHAFVLYYFIRLLGGAGGFSNVVATFNHVFYRFEFGIMCCMLSTFHVSSRIVANISESSLLLSQ